MHPRVLIIGTSPYTTSGTSRTFDASFHFWEKENVAQIFSRNWVPQKGHCGELYQITDAQLLKRWLHKTKETGTIYHYNELEEQSGIQEVQDTPSVGKLYSLGTKHSPTIELVRRILWRKKYWCTDKFNEWLDKFSPEVIDYSFSNHIFMQQIVLYVADRYDIPIVVGIGDDFYFNDLPSKSPSYLLYRKLFKHLTERILFRSNSGATYCSDKICKKYNEYFHLNGKPIFYNSTIERRPFRYIKLDDPTFVYFGSIRLGRNNSLLDIAKALGEINVDYKLEVYTNEKDEEYLGELKKNPNVRFGGAIPYSDVIRKIESCDVYVITEGFRDIDINYTRYSLSTKTSDSLASGAAILTYGPMEAGVVDYMLKSKASMVCTDKNKLREAITTLLGDRELQKQYYENAIEVSRKNHQVESTTAIFESVVRDVLVAK